MKVKRELRAIYKKNLDKLAALLRSGEFLTAKQIAKRLKCSQPTAYARLAGLQAIGLEVQSLDAYPPTTTGRTGPMPLVYFIP